MATNLEELTHDQLLETARQSQAVTNLVGQLMQNPETRESMQRLAKKANPAAVIPELDASDRIREEMKARDEKIAALEAKMQEKEVAERLERDRRAAIKKHGLSEEDIPEVEKTMVDHQIASYDAAARLRKAEKAPSVPTTGAIRPPHRFDMPEGNTWGKGVGDSAALNRIAMDEAHKALHEFRQKAG